MRCINKKSGKFTRALFQIGCLLTLVASLTSAKTIPSHVALKGLKGDSIELDELCKGKITVLVFWKGCCFSGKKVLSDLARLRAEIENPELIIVAISTDTTRNIPQVKAYASARKFPFPVLFDTESKLAKIMNPRGIQPYTVILDRQGSVVFEKARYHGGDWKHYKDRILELLEETGKKAAIHASDDKPLQVTP
ncbi:peroxiredoxin family protein [Acidobacteriota bacterium]